MNYSIEGNMQKVLARKCDRAHDDLGRQPKQKARSSSLADPEIRGRPSAGNVDSEDIEKPSRPPSHSRSLSSARFGERG